VTAREMLLEQVITRLECDRDRLRSALLALKRGDYFCEVAIGNPMYSRHTDECDRARDALKVSQQPIIVDEAAEFTPQHAFDLIARHRDQVLNGG
jgi:hypothetical protein